MCVSSILITYLVRLFPADGISIPSSYTAHLAPLSSSKLYNEAHVGKDEKSVETPYVVMFQAVNILSADGSVLTSGRCGPQIQECWEFEHPRKEAVLDARGGLPASSVSPCANPASRSAINE